MMAPHMMLPRPPEKGQARSARRYMERKYCRVAFASASNGVPVGSPPRFVVMPVSLVAPEVDEATCGRFHTGGVAVLGPTAEYLWKVRRYSPEPGGTPHHQACRRLFP